MVNFGLLVQPAVARAQAGAVCDMSAQIVSKTAVEAGGQTYFIARLTDGSMVYLNTAYRPVSNAATVREISAIDEVAGISEKAQTGHATTLASGWQQQIANAQSALASHLGLTGLDFATKVLGMAAATAVDAFMTGGASLPADLPMDAKDAATDLLTPQTLSSLLIYDDATQAEQDYRQMTALQAAGVTTFAQADQFLTDMAQAQVDETRMFALMSQVDGLNDSGWQVVLNTLTRFTQAFAGRLIEKPASAQTVAQVGKYVLTANGALNLESELTQIAKSVPAIAAYLQAGRQMSSQVAVMLPDSPSYLLSMPAKYTLSLASPGAGCASAPASAVMPVPDVTAVSPDPVAGANRDQWLTLHGANFAADDTVTLIDLGEAYPIPPGRTRYVSSSELQVYVDVTTAPGEWAVRVVNAGGEMSNEEPFDVVAPLASTQVAVVSISPNPVVGANGDQSVALVGSGFQQGARVTLTSLGQTFPVPQSRTQYVNSSEIDVSVDVTTQAASWTVQVTNPDGTTSNVYSFKVVAPASSTGPAISYVSPDPVTGSDSDQWVSIYGSGFAQGASVTLASLGETFPIPSSATQYDGSGEIQVYIDVTTQAASWTAVVTNPDGQSSNVAGFSVQ